MSQSSILAQGSVNPSGDLIIVRLVEPDDTPARIEISWPDLPTVASPDRLEATVNAAHRVLAKALAELDLLNREKAARERRSR